MGATSLLIFSPCILFSSDVADLLFKRLSYLSYLCHWLLKRQRKKDSFSSPHWWYPIPAGGTTGGEGSIGSWWRLRASVRLAALVLGCPDVLPTQEPMWCFALATQWEVGLGGWVELLKGGRDCLHPALLLRSLALHLGYQDGGGSA